MPPGVPTADTTPPRAQLIRHVGDNTAVVGGTAAERRRRRWRRRSGDDAWRGGENGAKDHPCAGRRALAKHIDKADVLVVMTAAGWD